MGGRAKRGDPPELWQLGWVIKSAVDTEALSAKMEQVKRGLLSLIAMGLLMALVSPAHATLINGTFSGTISGGAISEINGSYIYRPVGTPVTATFSYDTAYLSAPDASGNRQDSFFDPVFYFTLLVGGSPFAEYFNGTNPGADAISEFMVNADGLPVTGRGSGGWDMYFGPGTIDLYQPPYDALAASINGTFSVPDAAGTSWLLGMAVTALVIARRFTRRPLADKTDRS
jgi:hypothetical protein